MVGVSIKMESEKQANDINVFCGPKLYYTEISVESLQLEGSVPATI